MKMRLNADNFAAQFKGKNGKFKIPKMEMPVHVDVDFINPAMDTVKRTARNVWMQLPPQVQQAAPYVAVGFTTSLVVYRVKQHQFHQEQKKNLRLSEELDKTVVERDELRLQVRDLKAIAKQQANAPRSASEMRMAAAVAESTTAAAAAATAAANAASKCLFIRPGDRKTSRGV
ncbi:hypothetical protein WJX72_004208 [[Myrmecia] bisecta]|uniref:Uncharacterized protein n=1 Tax=[Myrmecia] bisecta TaxID=41462 RepID=A0AAW1Q7I9_9CHLO